MLRVILLLGGAIAAIVILAKILGRPRRPDVKCVTCCHCRKLFQDGVMCGFRDKEVFKNPVQIEMCPDHDPRRL